MIDFDKFLEFLDNSKAPTNEELAKLESVFIDFDIKDQELALRWLDDYFSIAKDNAYKIFWPSYFRWYVKLSWLYLNSQDINFIERVFARQIPMAILLNFDVFRKFMWYLVLKSLDKDDKATIYNRARNAFLNSEAAIGLYKGQEIKVADMVAEIKIVKSREKSTIINAEMMSKLKQTMFPKNDEFFTTHFFVEPDEAVARMYDLINFFLEVEAKDIARLVDSFESEAVSAVSTSSQVLPNLSKLAPPAPPVKPVAKPIPPRPSAPPKPIPPPAPATPTLAEIRRAVEKQFALDDAEGIINKLNELAEKYKNPKIAEIYYFDESEEKFKWTI